MPTTATRSLAARLAVAPREPRYRLVAPVYDGLACLYSGGAIPASKRWVTQQLGAAERVLFAGCGTGADARRAAARGASVTGLDESPHMLARARRATRAGAVDWCCADVRDLPGDGAYDAVVAAFFLNVFAPPQRTAVLSHLVALLRPGGRLLVADFARRCGPGLPGALQQLYHDLPMHIFTRLTGSAGHPIHDVAAALAAAGLQIAHQRRFRLFGVGPGWIEGLVTVKAGTDP